MAQPRDQASYTPPKSAIELLARYASGERDFRKADLFGANLSSANLSSTNLNGANLQDANLCGADLSGANLFGANLNGAILNGANLNGANLTFANLIRADLGGANLCGAVLGFSVLARVSLIEFCKADPPIFHSGPSAIDFESITLSLLAPNLVNFLVRAGIPAIAAQYMIDSAQGVKGSVWDMMQSVFISFGGPDEPFARKLYEALHSNGVRTFFFPEHAEPGEKLHRMMRDGVNKHDRVILICSKASLDRKGVLNEIEETLARESRDGGEAYLIPIRLDDYVFSGWKPSRPDIAQAIRDRVVADFEGTMTDQVKFDAALSKLLRSLRVKNPAPTTP